MYVYKEEKKKKLVWFIVGSHPSCSASKSEHTLCKGENLEIPEHDFATVLRARELENPFSSPYMTILYPEISKVVINLVTLFCMSNYDHLLEWRLCAWTNIDEFPSVRMTTWCSRWHHEQHKDGLWRGNTVSS